MSENLKTWPERIYIQHTDDDEPMPFNEASRNQDEVTWCDIRQFPADVEYVRADLAAPSPTAPSFAPLLEKIATFPELNMNNYDEEQVRNLNEWGMTVAMMAEELPAPTAPSDARKALVYGRSYDRALERLVIAKKHMSREQRRAFEEEWRAWVAANPAPNEQ